MKAEAAILKIENRTELIPDSCVSKRGYCDLQPIQDR